MNIAHGLWSNSFAFRVERDALFQEPGERWTASWDRNGSTPRGVCCGHADVVVPIGYLLMVPGSWNRDCGQVRQVP